MKRALAACLFALGLAVAGSFSAAVVADTGTTTGTTSSTSSTATTGPATTTTTSTTTTVSTTTATTTTTSTVLPGRLLPDGVRVAGVDVSGLKPTDAVAAVQAAFSAPLTVVVDRSRLQLDPTKVATAYAALAVARARTSAPDSRITLTVNVNGAALRAWVAAVAHRFDRQSKDATLSLRNGRPFLSPDRSGRALSASALTRSLVATLESNRRTAVRVHTKTIQPTVTRAGFGPVIVINRSLNRLQLFSGMHLVRTFPVATGQAIYPPPKGTWDVVVKWKNPWWYPPTQDAWAKGLTPVPPGPSNPLGTRWMGLDAPGVGIHGTDEPSSIGYSASHGCIRMQVPDAEWLFERVDVGTTVFII